MTPDDRLRTPTTAQLHTIGSLFGAMSNLRRMDTAGTNSCTYSGP